MIAVYFLAGLAIIVVASELFTNAVEWAGFRLKLGTGATGSLLAALGTSLPETVVPIVALATGVPAAAQVATGAVLGSSFLLLTLGVSVTGLAVLQRRKRPTLHIDVGQARRDLGTFVGAFGLVILAMALPKPFHYAIGVVLLVIYVIYVVFTLRSGTPTETMPEPLHMLRWRPDADPSPLVIALQLVLAVAGLIAGSDLFVRGIDDTASALNLNPLILALVAIPFATEMPECLNSVLWVRANDDGLAFGNVAGSATFQACVLGFIGLCFTPWQPGGSGLFGAMLSELTALALLVVLWRGHSRGLWLVLAAVPWLAYVAVTLATGGHVGAVPG